MIQASKPAAGETRGYHELDSELCLRDCRPVIGMARHSRACTIVERNAAFEVWSRGQRIGHRRSVVAAAKLDADHYLAHGYVPEDAMWMLGGVR